MGVRYSVSDLKFGGDGNHVFQAKIVGLKKVWVKTSISSIGDAFCPFGVRRYSGGGGTYGEITPPIPLPSPRS